MRSGLLWSFCSAAACATALLPAGASAAPGLASDDHAFPAATVDAPDVKAAFAPNGFAAVAWIEQAAGGEGVVRVALRPPGQDWSEAATLDSKVNRTDPPTGRTLSNVQVAVNAQGDAAVAWAETKSPSTFTVAVSSRPANGTFRHPELLDPAIAPLVGVDANGQVTFVNGVDTASSDGEFARTAPAGASLAGAPADPLSTTCGSFDSDLAVAPSGEAIVGFHCNGIAFSVRRSGIWATSTPFVENFVSCPNLGTSTTFSGVHVAIDGEGHAAGVAKRTDSSSDCAMFPTTTRSDSIVLAVPAAGGFAGVQVASSGTGTNSLPPPNDVFLPGVGIGGGSIVAEWLVGNDNDSMFQPATRTYPHNGSDPPGPVEPIGAFGGFAGSGEVGVDASGRALVTWAEQTDGKIFAFAAFRPLGGAFGQPLPVSDGTTDVSVTSGALGESGDGVVAWLQGPASGHVAHARGFDATPPQLSGVSIPAAAQVGTPAAFGAQVFDVWGPVSFSWDFGDGATATGANTSHAFGAAGHRTVTVSATDSAGNSASQNGGLEVTGVPGGVAAPRLADVTQTHPVFRVGTRPTATNAAKRRRAPVGTTFRFSLSRPASVAIKIAQAQPGRRSGKRCVKPTKRLAHKKRCTRFVLRGTLRRSGELGVNKVPFSGRIGRRALKPGKYRATFVATAGGLSSKAIALRFRVVR